MTPKITLRTTKENNLKECATIVGSGGTKELNIQIKNKWQLSQDSHVPTVELTHISVNSAGNWKKMVPKDLLERIK